MDAAAPDTGPPQPQCNDGIDNDGDGRIDFPDDPGCAVPQQDSETDDCPDGSGCPQCANGRDDDANGQTDYPDDPGCSSAGDFDEYTLNPGACGSAVTIHQLPSTGQATGTLDDTQVYDQVSTCGGGTGGMIVVAAYELHLTSPKVLIISTEGSAVDTVLDLRGADCQADTSELACDDNGVGLQSKVTYSAQAGTYYILVEAKTASDVGMYKLTVQQLAGEGAGCLDTSECGPGLICRIPHGSTTMSCEQPVCNDGRDDDDDGKMDYPADPGCATPDDSDETDDCPSGPNCPVCANGVDDDNDGNTDYPADTSCSAAAGGSEACQGEQDPIAAIVTPTTASNMTGAHDNHNPSCGADGGADLIYTMKVPELRSLTIDTNNSAFDTVLSMMTAACTEPSIACNDDGGTPFGSSKITRTNVGAGTYIVAVDARSSSTSLGSGAYEVHVTGVIQPGGACNPEDTLGGAFTCPAANPCGGPTGSMICEPSVCSDGIDNDGDGKTDYPADPGCSSLDDGDEADACPGTGCPACADGVDNDGDGQTDYPNDASCTFAGQNTEGCTSTEPVLEITSPVTQDDTTGATNDVDPSCTSTSATALAPDHTYSINLPAMKSLSLVGSSSFDGVLALYDSTCGGAALACQDGETITRQNVSAGTYFVVIDGWSSGSGTTTLTVSGVIQNGGSCEVPLAQSGAFVCATGFTCAGTPGSRTCRPAACNDGLDNDGDGVADFPNDPGCTSTSDNDESDSCPNGAGCPVCSNGLDDDGDSLIDYPDDPSCSSASATSEACASSEAVIPLVLPSTAGTTVGATNDDIPACSSSTNTAGDLTYSLTVPALTSLTIANVNSFSSAVSLYDSSCGGTPLQCNTTDTIQLGAVAAGTYYYVIDGSSTSTGAYTINLSGTIAGGASCEGVLADAGALTCTAGFQCAGAMGSRTCQPTQCNDGVDNDGDGHIDYPAEPGCASVSDNDETDDCPSGPNCPACANGLDDDGDGQMDYPSDTSCTSAGGGTEESCTNDMDNFGQITAPTTTGDLTNAVHDLTLSCQSNTGHDASYILDLPVAVASLQVDTNGSTVSDTVVDLWQGQCATSVHCDDDSGDGNRSLLTETNLAAGTYAITVAGWSSGNNGPFTLNVHGTLAAGTACDSALFTAGVLACDTGLTCTGSPATCQ